MCERGVRWLLSAQNADGGWGGAGSVASSLEETALAVEALAAAGPLCGDPSAAQAICRGAQWLIVSTHHGTYLPASPIGLYFASLWYFEQLYPLIFALTALSRVSQTPAAGR
jgi:squalene-hopene/tetraprenyl-beta-curcumene cyclase